MMHVCRGCGVLLPAEFAQCVGCGTPVIASVTQPAAPDRHLKRCDACGQWKDKRTACITCNGKAARCFVCQHKVNEHSSEPGVGCLHIKLTKLGEHDAVQCPCEVPGTSQADQ